MHFWPFARKLESLTLAFATGQPLPEALTLVELSILRELSILVELHVALAVAFVALRSETPSEMLPLCELIFPI